jgi:zinc and cadmium transporter
MHDEERPAILLCCSVLTMSPFALSILLGLTAALANMLGGAIVLRRHWERESLKYFIALGAGFMLAAAFLEMIPESFELAGHRAAIYILIGYLIVHFAQHTLAPHFHFGEETHHDEFVHAHTGYRVLIGMMVHCFFDGIAIASGFLVSNWLGWIIFLAVILHKLPEGFTVSSVMLAAGRSRRTALLSAALLGAATLAGVLGMAGFAGAVSVGLPLAAGVTIYVAASDLVPEVNKEPGIKMALVFFLGVGLLFLLDVLFHTH